MVALPTEGDSKPASTLSRVVLPAPLGPSSPVTPGPKEQRTSETATFCPNHFERSVATNRGVGYVSRVRCVRRAGHVSFRYRQPTRSTLMTARPITTMSEASGPKPPCAGITMDESRPKIQSRIYRGCCSSASKEVHRLPGAELASWKKRATRLRPNNAAMNPAAAVPTRLANEAARKAREACSVK